MNDSEKLLFGLQLSLFPKTMDEVVKRKDIVLDFTEYDKLIEGLINRNIPYEEKELHGGKQVLVKTDLMNWDAVIHSLSYGCENGLLEIMGSIVPDTLDDDVIGWLTAEDILEKVDKIN